MVILVYNELHQLTEDTKMAKAKAIVTRESIQAMLDDDRPEYVALVVGRALVRLFERQTTRNHS